MSDEMPGALELAIGVHEQRWPHTTDAYVWAKEFLARFPAASPNHPNEADMIGWFANAIMAGFDTANMGRVDVDAEARKALAAELEFEADSLLNLLNSDLKPNVSYMRDLITSLRTAVRLLRGEGR